MLRTQIHDALKDAMRNKDERAVGTIRLIISKMKDLDIAARPMGNTIGIDGTAIVNMLQSMIKQRRESITLYEKGNRADLAKQENEEIAIIERFLPKQMGEDEIKKVIADIVASIGAKDIKDMGKVMAVLKGKYTGQMDFGAAGAVLKGKLG
jgi:uncharacterized protein YqeY